MFVRVQEEWQDVQAVILELEPLLRNPLDTVPASGPATHAYQPLHWLAPHLYSGAAERGPVDEFGAAAAEQSESRTKSADMVLDKIARWPEPLRAGD